MWVYKNIGWTIDVKISVATGFMARKCNHGKGSLFYSKGNLERQKWTENKNKNKNKGNDVCYSEK